MIPILFNQRMWCDNRHDVSPSSKKPKIFVDEARKHDLALIVEFSEPLTKEDFYLAHDRKFVEGVLNLTIANGFKTYSKEVADTLYWTSASLYQACKYASSRSDKKIACAPVSGFHHAGYNFTMGFCTFNGLMVCAIKLLRENPGFYKKIAIIDCDAHYGNGTDDILNRLPEYKKVIYHNTFGKKFPDRCHDEPYTLEESNLYIEEFIKVEKDLTEFKPDLIIYQAGADPHINDPYGKILTTEQMYTRDLKMFQISKRLDIPIAWNLAGGYQVDANGSISKVIELHLNTIKAAIEVYD